VRISLLAAASGLSLLLMAIGVPQQASAAGKFDGAWKGDVGCSSHNASSSGTMVILIDKDTVTNITWDDGDSRRTAKLTGQIGASGSLEVKEIYKSDAEIKLSGKYSTNYIKLTGDLSDEEASNWVMECSGKLTRNNNANLVQAWERRNKKRPQQVASNSSNESRKAAEADRKRLQQEIAALKKQNEEARRLAEVERNLQKEETQRLAENERKRIEAERKRQEETKRLAEIERKRKAEAGRLVDAERKRKAEAKRLAEVERKRKEEKAKRLAAAERKRKAEVKRIAALEKKRKAEEAKKRKAARQTASTAGGGGQLRQQLAILKQLQSDGFIDEQEFKSKKDALLARFLGLNSAQAVKVSRAVKPKNTELKKSLAKYSDVKFGTYHALVIGSNDYKYLPKLKTAKSDAKAVAKTLKSKYGYKVRTLINATRQNILDAFDEYRETLTKTDNLLIYYAGHGFLDEEDNRGYWMPVDARPNRRSAWLSNADITGTLKALKANHVMVMADSCYSGTLTRGLSIKKRSSDYVREVADKKARVVITSGGLEPVADKSGGNHSPFASVFLDVLNSNNGVLDGTNLFNKMRRPVMLKADQTPAYADVRKAGHDGGDFLFVRKR
jgi:hypothetical protein